MKTKILNLREAYKFYILINPVVSLDEINKENLSVFVEELVINIIYQNYEILFSLLELVTDEKKENIIERNKLEIIGILADALEKNRIIELIEFFKGLETWQIDKN